MRVSDLRVAIVGAGPSGIYAAEALSSLQDVTVDVDIFDALPVPFGLVRYGVAPDHTSIRGVRDTLDKTLNNPGVRFFGNVRVGVDISLSELGDDYDAVLLTYGASTDQQLGVSGEGLIGSIPATELVSWYCGNPDAQRELIENAIQGVTNVVVIGVGNVAVDVARILAKASGELGDTDMPQHVLDALSSTSITDVHIVGRRGPAQASFTTKELRELGELLGVDVIVNPADLDFDAHSLETIASHKVAARNVEVMKEWATRTPQNLPRRLHFHFFRRPVEIMGSDRVESVVLERTEFGDDGQLRGTGSTERLASQLIVRSVGYRGESIDGVDVDQRSGTITNSDGRVIQDGTVVPGLYVAGWIKRGPSGIIGTNKKCAVATVDALLADHAAGALPTPGSIGSVVSLLEERGIDYCTTQNWRNIDIAERELGQSRGRERTTIHERSDLIAAGHNQ
jgi:NADPH-dependent glutamate synthase beta subunit-like oxidoreductase